MKISEAILNVLSTLPRPVTAEVVAAQLPNFYAKPVKLEEVRMQLDVLVQTADVHRQAGKHVGLLYTITPAGRAAIA